MVTRVTTPTQPIQPTQPTQPTPTRAAGPTIGLRPGVTKPVRRPPNTKPAPSSSGGGKPADTPPVVTLAADAGNLDAILPGGTPTLAIAQTISAAAVAERLRSSGPTGRKPMTVDERAAFTKQWRGLLTARATLPGVGPVRVWPKGVGCGWSGGSLAALGGDAGRSPLTAYQKVCMSNAMTLRYLAGEAAWVPIVDAEHD